MCTVSIIPLGENAAEGIRLVSNRDESRLRPAGLPPRIERFGMRQAILPRDPQAGGTWIAVNDAGIAIVLLNATPEPGKELAPGRVTRGEIIPSLLDVATLSEARSRAEEIDVARYAPFRLLIADRRELVELAIRDRTLVPRDQRRIERPVMFTSSALGDALVAEPRRRLFAEMFDNSRDWLATQDAFHRHRWRGREGISVSMTRADAMTVSQTIIELNSERAVLTYFAGPPGESAPAISLSLPIASTSLTA